MSSQIAEEINLPVIQISSRGIVVISSPSTLIESFGCGFSIRIRRTTLNHLNSILISQRTAIGINSLASCTIKIIVPTSRITILIPSKGRLTGINLTVGSLEAHSLLNSNIKRTITQCTTTHSISEGVGLCNFAVEVSIQSGRLDSLQTFPVEVGQQNQRGELLVNESVDNVNLILNVVDGLRQLGHVSLQFLLQVLEVLVSLSLGVVVSQLSINIVDLLGQLSIIVVDLLVDLLNLTVDTIDRVLESGNVNSVKSLQLLLHLGQPLIHSRLVGIESLLLLLQVLLNSSNGNFVSLSGSLNSTNLGSQLLNSLVEVTLQSGVLGSQLFQILLLSILVKSSVDGIDLCLQGSVLSGQSVDRRHQLLNSSSLQLNLRVQGVQIRSVGLCAQVALKLLNSLLQLSILGIQALLHCFQLTC